MAAVARRVKALLGKSLIFSFKQYSRLTCPEIAFDCIYKKNTVF